jgi:glycosyltransferase involved in cell wall biosynthesis
MRAPRVLLFAPHFAPFANPEAFVANKFALAAIEAGWDLEVVSRNYRGVLGYDYGSGWADPWHSLQGRCFEISYPLRREPARSTAAIYSAIRLGHPIEGCRWARHAVEFACQRHKANPYHAIVSRSAPDSAHLAGLAMAKRTKVPWVASLNDPAVEITNRALDGAIQPPFFHRRFLKEVLRMASWLTFPSSRFSMFVGRSLGEPVPAKSSAVPHTAIDFPAFEAWRSHEYFTLCHAGYMTAQRSPHVFLEALAGLSKRNGIASRIKFLVVGLENVGLIGLAKAFGVGHLVEFTGPVSYEESLRATQRCDVSVVLEAPIREGICLPAKFVDYIQVGRPILAVSPHQGNLADILGRCGGGLAADCLSPASVESAILEFYEHWEKGTLEEMYGSRRLLPLFSKARTLQQYEEIFEHIGVNEGSGRSRAGVMGTAM